MTAPTGWLCPRCGAVNAPHLDQCPCARSSDRRPPVTDREIADLAWHMACDLHGVDHFRRPTGFRSHACRRRQPTLARHTAFVMLMDVLGWSKERVAEAASRDVNAVRYGITKIASWIDTEPDGARRFDTLKRSFADAVSRVDKPDSQHER